MSKLVLVEGAEQLPSWRLTLSRGPRTRRRHFTIQGHQPFAVGDELPAELLGESGWLVEKIATVKVFAAFRRVRMPNREARI